MEMMGGGGRLVVGGGFHDDKDNDYKMVEMITNVMMMMFLRAEGPVLGCHERSHARGWQALCHHHHDRSLRFRSSLNLHSHVNPDKRAGRQVDGAGEV
eukprot:766514-Hanusia_phi.AAC.8